MEVMPNGSDGRKVYYIPDFTGDYTILYLKPYDLCYTMPT